MSRPIRLLLALPTILALLAFSVSAAGALPGYDPPEKGVPTPASVLGWKPCTDYKLSNYEQITQYFRKLDRASDRVKLVNLGKTSEGRDQVMAIVSSPENLRPANLERYRRISVRLAETKGLDAKEAKALAAQGKTVAWVDFGIHSTEVAPTQTAPQFAYDLVTSESEEARSIRKNVITLFVPNINPDGTTMVSDWYMKYVGTKYQDSRYPELYHKYAGHDDNRDWFMFNLAETKNLGEVLFHSWLPQLVYNTHQTAAYPARIFIPPFKDPSNPNIPPEIIRGINAVGDQMTQRLDREGKVGAVSRQQYDQWWNGGLRSAPAFHNQVGILSETAHASATPKYEDPTKFPATFPYQGVSTSEPSAFYPSPYRGGTWHLADSCAYIESTGWAYLHTADVDRENWLYGMYRMGVAATKAGGDTSYVVPGDQADHPTVVKFVNVLRQNNIRVERATSAFTAGGTSYPAGSYVVREAQPFRADVVDLLNPQKYPDRRNPDGTPERPYDMAGWTLQYQMGVDVTKVGEPFTARTEPVSTEPVPRSSMPAKTPGYGYALDPRVNDAFTAATKLARAGETVTRATGTVDTDRGDWPAGTFLVQVRPGAENRVAAQAKALGLTVAGVAAEPEHGKAMKVPRVGLYHGWGGNSDEGWTRYVLEQFRLPYQQLHDRDVRAGDLTSKYDVIVLPDASYAQMRDGLKAGTLPERYTGGMTAKGVANLEEFVKKGGRVVAVNGAGELPIKAFDLPVADVTDGVPATEYYSPGSVVATTVTTGTPWTYGLPRQLDAYSDHSPAYRVEAGARGVRSVVDYPADGVLRSGWLLGEKVVANRSVVVDAEHGAGDVVLLGLSVQHRAQAHGTYKLLFNAVYGVPTG